MHGPRKGSQTSNGTQATALKIENSRLFRDIARLQAEVDAHRKEGSFEQMQVQNSKLVHQVKVLEQESQGAKRELDRMREAAQTMQSSMQAEIEGLRQAVEEAKKAALEASNRPPPPKEPVAAVEEAPAPSAEDPDVAPPPAAAPSPAPVAAAPPPVVHRDPKQSAKDKDAEEAAEDRANQIAATDAEFAARTGAAPIPPVVNVQKQREWAAHKGALIEPFIRSGAYAFVCAEWLVRFAERFAGRKPLPKRQDLPPDAFMSLEELKAAGSPYELLPIFVVSGPWLLPSHPDPRGDFVRLIARALKPLMANGQRYAVFWDWFSMLQAADSQNSSLDPDEKATQTEALAGLPTLYSHPFVTVLQLTELPADYPDGKDADGKQIWDLPTGGHTSTYFNRGWCWTETMWVSWSGKRPLDLGRLAVSKEPHVDRRTLFKLAYSPEALLAPLSPPEYKAELTTKSFLHVKEDEPFLLSTYSKAFEAHFSSARKIEYSDAGWGEEEVLQLCRVLSSGVAPKLEWLHLVDNKINDAAMRELAEMIGKSNSPVPNVSAVALDGNPGNATPVLAALAAQAERKHGGDYI